MHIFSMFFLSRLLLKDSAVVVSNIHVYLLLKTIGVNLFIGFMNPMVDNWGHLGGLVGGAIAAYYFGPRLFLLEYTTGSKALVDSPIVRLPKTIENIPDEVKQAVNKRYQNLSKRLNIDRKRPGLREKPWRDPWSNQ